MRPYSVGALAVLFILSTSAFATSEFPESPDARLTPGSLCQKPSETRYPEKIKYCKRSVGKTAKQTAIDKYDDRLGYHVGEMKRQAFKIDHYIPLCMGGSNEQNNLWPQHESVFVKTDPLEQKACEKMAKGLLLQEEAIQIIRDAKADPDQAHRFIAYVDSL